MQGILLEFSSFWVNAEATINKGHVEIFQIRGQNNGSALRYTENNESMLRYSDRRGQCCGIAKKESMLRCSKEWVDVEI
jgi:hypothetical protein